MRYFIEFAYRGTAYCGWQSQPNGIAVQQVLENSLSTLLREQITVTGAGRTDAGVHARQMFAHFDTQLPFDAQELARRLNSFLPADILVYGFKRVCEEAHARFDATSRKYEYRITTRKDPFSQDTKLFWYSTPLDAHAMNRVCPYLLSHTDFECFSKVKTDVKTFLCQIGEARWEKPDAHNLVFHIRADRFLRNMVRAVVGTMLEVGSGKMASEDIAGVLESKNRSQAGASVPAHGLFLTEVTYPEDIFIPTQNAKI